MITGWVTEREARIRLKERDARGGQRQIEAVIDTGYTASLTLPPQLIQDLAGSFPLSGLDNSARNRSNGYPPTKHPGYAEMVS